MAALDIKQLLAEMARWDASDLHIKVGNPPALRVHGTLKDMNLPAAKPDQIDEIARSLLTEEQYLTLEQEKEIDFAFKVEKFGRFRTNIYYQKGSKAIAFRLHPYADQDYRRADAPARFTGTCSPTPSDLFSSPV